jgi:6-pyruvoyltetrahydropterin/6-carboxytetrahydropterin synthase
MVIKVTVCRKAHFNAAHRLYRDDWSAEQNAAIYGVCANPNFHGHNYNLTVRVLGPIDPETGYVMDLKILGSLIETEVVQKLDHKNLNLDVPEFKTLVPTAEHIAVVIWKFLRPHLDESLQLSVCLFETERNFVEFDGLGLGTGSDNSGGKLASRKQIAD